MGEHALTKLFEVCSRHHLATWQGRQVVIPEPYIPHFPVDGVQWNGVLVLAEAQNLANTDYDYPGRLQRARAEGNREALWNRLNLSWSRFPEPFATPADGIHRDVAIRPWQNGVIPFVVASLAELGRGGAANVLRTGDPLAAVGSVMVSNAVPWSRVDAGANVNPGGEEVGRAAEFWAELLPALDRYAGEVKLLLAFGKTAERVMQRAATRAPILALLGPFGLNRARLRREEQQLAPEMRTQIRVLAASMGGRIGLRTPGDRELAYLSAASALRRWQQQPA